MGTGARPLCSETLKDNSLGVGGELLPLYQVRILQRLYSLPLEVRLTLRVRASGISGWSREAPEQRWGGGERLWRCQVIGPRAHRVQLPHGHSQTGQCFSPTWTKILAKNGVQPWVNSTPWCILTSFISFYPILLGCREGRIARSLLFSRIGLSYRTRWQARFCRMEGGWAGTFWGVLTCVGEGEAGWGRGGSWTCHCSVVLGQSCSSPGAGRAGRAGLTWGVGLVCTPASRGHLYGCPLPPWTLMQTSIFSWRPASLREGFSCLLLSTSSPRRWGRHSWSWREPGQHASPSITAPSAASTRCTCLRARCDSSAQSGLLKQHSSSETRHKEKIMGQQIPPPKPQRDALARRRQKPTEGREDSCSSVHRLLAYTDRQPWRLESPSLVRWFLFLSVEHSSTRGIVFACVKCVCSVTPTQ